MKKISWLCLPVLFLFVLTGCSTNKKSELEGSFGEGNAMGKKILVTYGSFSGSTAETAIFIGKKLSEKGMQADVLPVNKIKSVDGYDGVIIGSAVMMGKMKGPVINFVTARQSALSKVPVAYFLVCLTMQNDTAETRKTASGYLEPVRSVVEPISEGLFPGKVDFKTLPFPVSLLTLMPAFKKGVPEGDYRDWVKVEKWVGETVSKFN